MQLHRFWFGRAANLKLSDPIFILGGVMKVVLVEIPEAARGWINERALLGHDRHDEMWDGVVHMVPPPSFRHQDRGSALLSILRPLAKAAGLHATYETGVFRPGSEIDYRQPDLVVANMEHVSARGVEGRAALVVEIRSPGDESWEKLTFFAEMGIPEVLIIEHDGPVLLRLNESSEAYNRVEADTEGFVSLALLPVLLRPRTDGAIEVRTAAGSEIV
jgi:Uma2 family endonuclease